MQTDEKRFDRSSNLCIKDNSAAIAIFQRTLSKESNNEKKKGTTERKNERQAYREENEDQFERITPLLGIPISIKANGYEEINPAPRGSFSKKRQTSMRKNPRSLIRIRLDPIYSQLTGERLSTAMWRCVSISLRKRESHPRELVTTGSVLRIDPPCSPISVPPPARIRGPFRIGSGSIPVSTKLDGGQVSAIPRRCETSGTRGNEKREQGEKGGNKRESNLETGEKEIDRSNLRAGPFPSKDV